MSDDLTPADRLARAAKTLHGDEHWRLRFARDVGIDDDTLRRWMTGRTLLRADHGVFDDTVAVLRRRADEIRRSADDLARWMEAARGGNPAPAKATAASAPTPSPPPHRPGVGPIRLSRRQIKEADRIGGVELIIPYPSHMTPPKLREGEEADATAAELAYARQALGDLMQHDLVMVRVAVARMRRPTGLPREEQVETHLCCILIGRRWVHATGGKQPKTMWHGEA